MVSPYASQTSTEISIRLHYRGDIGLADEIRRAGADAGLMQLPADAPDASFLSRWSPAARIVIVMACAGLTSAAFHVIGFSYARGAPANGDGLGAFGVVVYGSLLGFVTIWIVLAVARVRRSWAVWSLGFPLGMIALVLTAYGLAQSHAATLATRLGLPASVPFVIGDSLAVAVTFGLACLPSDPRPLADVSHHN